MTCYTLFSGSSGNCIYIKQGNTEILVDAGQSAKMIDLALRSVGTSLSNIRAVYVTHEHSDHVKGLGQICKSLSVPVFCQFEVAKELYLGYLDKGMNSEATALAKCIRTILPGEEYETDEILVSPFKTPHDSSDSEGFVIGEKELGIATDIGHVSDIVRQNLCGCGSIILESNHDLEMLKTGPYPHFLKERVASENGHLNNADCAAFLTELIGAGANNFTLFHLSKENNTPEKAYAASAEAIASLGLSTKTDVCLRVAGRSEATKVL